MDQIQLIAELSLQLSFCWKEMQELKEQNRAEVGFSQTLIDECDALRDELAVKSEGLKQLQDNNIPRYFINNYQGQSYFVYELSEFILSECTLGTLQIIDLREKIVNGIGVHNEKIPIRTKGESQ